jgi:hypothetical protein
VHYLCHADVMLGRLSFPELALSRLGASAVVFPCSVSRLCSSRNGRQALVFHRRKRARCVQQRLVFGEGDRQCRNNPQQKIAPY